jgi:ribosome biogenesis GTPase A
MDMLDTPGVLWPKFDDRMVGLRLAATGAVSDEVVDKITLCESLLAMLTDIAPSSLESRYRLNLQEDTEPRRLLEDIGSVRGFKLKGGIIDVERTAIMVLDEFRGGKLGRVSLETPASLQI